MTSQEIKTNNYISLTEAAEKYTEYSQEYLSLRARQGKLKAVKIGRNWLTKKEWVEEYITVFNGNGEASEHALSDTKSSIKTIANGLRQKKSTATGPKLFSLGELENYSGYSQEYLSLRARQGKLKAVKIGRNWLMAKEWIDEYKNNVDNKQKISINLQNVFYPVLQLFKKQSAVLLAATILIFCSTGLAFGFPYINDLQQTAKKTAFEIFRPLGLRMTQASLSMTQMGFVILSEAKDLGFRMTEGVSLSMTQARDEASVTGNDFVSFLGEQKFALRVILRSEFQKEKQLVYVSLVDAILATENIENYIEGKAENFSRNDINKIVVSIAIAQKEFKEGVDQFFVRASQMALDEFSSQLSIFRDKNYQVTNFLKQAPVFEIGKLFKQSFFVLQDVVGQELKSTRGVALSSANGLVESTEEILRSLDLRMTQASFSMIEGIDQFFVRVDQMVVDEAHNQLSIFNDKNRALGQTLVFGEQEINKLFNQAIVSYLSGQEKLLMTWIEQSNAAGEMALSTIDGLQAIIENKAGDYWTISQDNWQYNSRVVATQVNARGDKLANNIENFSANLLENAQQGMAWLMIGSTNKADEFSLTFFQKIKFITSLTSQSLRATSQIAWDSAQVSGNAIGDKIVEGVTAGVSGLQSLTYSIYNRASEGLVKGYEFITRPWRERATQQLVKTTIVNAPVSQTIPITTLSTSSAEEMIAQLTPHESVPKEIISEVIKEAALSQIATINTIREVVKIDESSLVLIRSQIAELQRNAVKAASINDLKELRDLLTKIQATPPIYSIVSAAPAYIGSTGLQISGGTDFNSLGVSGLSGIRELSVGGSTILGKTAGDLLTVNASAEFLADVSFRKNINILADLSASGVVSFGTARGGALTITSTSSPQLTVAYNGSNYFNLVVDSVGSSTLASTGALNLTGNGASVWQTISSPLTIKTNTTGDILLSSAGNLTEKFATSSAYSLYQGETARLAINTAGDIGLTGDTTITGNTVIVGNSTTTGNSVISGNLIVSGTSTLTVTSASQLVIAGNTYFSALTAGSVPFIGASGLLSQDNSNLFWDSATARLGVGTTTPIAKLTVEGDTYFRGNTTTTGNLFVGGSLVVFGTSSSANIIVNSAVASNLIPDQNASRDLGSAAYFWDNFYIDNIVANNMSIASTSIGGTNSNDFVINSDNATADTETENLIFFRGTVVPNALLTWDSVADRFDFNQPILMQNDSSTTTVVSLDVRGKAGQIADLFRIASSSEESFFNITSAGLVGIGTTTPASKLDVWGNLQVGTSSTPVLYVNTGSQHVGIGTTTPATRLSVLGIAGESAMHISSSTGVSILHIDEYGNFGLGTSSPSAHLAIAGVVGLNAFQISSTTGATDFMVGQYGNVGIGTSTPYTKLDVYGSFQVGTSTTSTLTPLFIANTGSATVGIGTSTPSAKFAIAGVAGVNSLNIASTTGVSMLSLDQYGNLGVGKSGASRRVEIFDATNPQLRLTQASGSKYSEFQTNSLGDLIIASNLGQLFKTDSNDYSVAVGQDSGVNLVDTEAQFNTALGWQSLYSATSSDYNTAIGFWSLYNNTSGERNTALGANVLYSNVSGSINVAVGDNALYRNTTGGNNIALGPNTLLWNQTGEANTVIGSSAGGANFGSVVSSSFSSSTIIGMKAGYNLGSGSKNVLIGYQAGDSLTTGASNIIIGYDQDALTAGASNFLNIGGLIYGDLSLGNVGIGTSSPIAVLEVAGNASTSGGLLRISTSTTEALSINALGYVGLGTTSPSARLAIAGVAGINAFQIASTTGATDFMVGQYGNVGIGTSSPNARLDLLGRAGWASLHIASSTGANMMSIDGYGLLSFGIPDNQATAMTFSEGTNTYLTFDTTDGAEKVVMGKNFEVGTMEVDADSGSVQFVNMNITTTTATGTVEKLSISLDQQSILTVYGEADGNGNLQNMRVGIGTTTPIAMLSVRGNASTSGPLLQISTSTTQALYVDALGYVGLGTTSPSARLAIAGVAGINAFQIASTTGAIDFMVGQYGNVGIGTTTPSARLDILSRVGWSAFHIASSSGANMMSIDGNGLFSFGLPDNQASAMTFSEGSNTYLTFDTTDGAEKIVMGKDFEIGLMNITADSGEVDFVNMTVSTTTATNTVESLSIAIDDNSILTVYGEADGQGNLVNYRVGIGTTSPTAMLDIRGNASTSGALLRISTSTTEALSIDALGRVGMGTTTPATKLDIYGVGTQLRISTTSGYANFYVDNSGYLNMETQYSTTSALQITNSNVVINQPLILNSPGDLGLSYDLSMENPSAAYIRFAGAGYIQTESPFGNYNLTLSAANAGKVVINDDLQTTGQTNFVATTTQTLTTTSTIQVGGATHIVIDATATVVMVSAPTIADGVTGDIIIIRNATSNSITLQDEDTLPSSNLQLGSTGRALTNGSTIALMFDGTDWMELWYSGVSHADYAEMYKIKEDVSSGEVVSVNKDNYLQVQKAVLGDVDVAGIISASPAYLIGQEFRDEMQMPVALAGRVPVKISLEAGEIKKGDVLIPSTKPGYAMKYNEEYIKELGSFAKEPSSFQNIPIVGVALEDYGTTSIAGEFLETTYKTYKVKFKEGSDPAEINRLNGKYKVVILSQQAKDLEQTIEIRAEYTSGYFGSSLIETSQWLSDNIIRKPNPEFRPTDNSDETVLCMVKTGYVKVGPASGFSKLTVIEKDGQLAFEPEDKNFADSLDMAIEADGSLVVGKLKAKQAEIGSAEKPAGITLYDEETKQPYCLKMKAGAMISEAGKCGDPTSVIPSEPQASEESQPLATTTETGDSSVAPLPQNDTSSTSTTSTEPAPLPAEAPAGAQDGETPPVEQPTE